MALGLQVDSPQSLQHVFGQIHRRDSAMEIDTLEGVLQQNFRTVVHREIPSLLIPIAAELLKLGEDVQLATALSPAPILDLITQIVSHMSHRNGFQVVL